MFIVVFIVDKCLIMLIFFLKVVALGLSFGIIGVNMVLKMYLLCVQVRIYAIGAKEASLEQIRARIEPNESTHLCIDRVNPVDMKTCPFKKSSSQEVLLKRNMAKYMPVY